MEIRINKLRLHNFKGMRDAEYTFEGRNARIEGTNGSGKSTVFDAFTWLLFGKDHRDQSADSFEIKTIDPETGAPIPRLEHWVEAELLVDGMLNTLRRCWIEDWVTPTGKTEPVMMGHKSMFIVNGVDVGTKRAYDTTIQAWMNEDAFRLITNPLYFIGGTDWQTRRKALLDLVKDSPERDRVRKDFADVVDRLSGRSLDAYRKQLKAEKAANKRDLDMARRNIEGMRQTLPESVNEEEIRSDLEKRRKAFDSNVEDIRKQREAITSAIASSDSANAEKKAQVDAIWAEITNIQITMGNDIAQAQKAAQEENNRAKAAALQAWNDKELTERRVNTMAVRVKREEGDLEELMKQRGIDAAELKALGDEYKAEKTKAFSYTPRTTCEFCGQELPAATIEQAEAKAHEAFVSARKKTLEGIIEKAERIKASIGRIDETIAKSKSMIEEHKAEISKDEDLLGKLKAKYEELKAVPMKDLDAIAEEIRRPADKMIQELRLKASKAEVKDETKESRLEELKELQAKEDVLVQEFSAIQHEAAALLAVNSERKRQLAMIERKEQEANGFADAVARNERDEARVAQFVEADIRSVENSLNALFRVARWKMFDRTMDGGLVEMCEVTSPEGVPYRSMNDAMKTLCGMDVIRVFSDRFQAQAPIFIDNAEGIIRTNFGTSAQVIRLVVKDCPITLVNE